MAEIPTFQAGRIDAGAYARRIAANAQLTVDGQDAALVPVAHALAHPRGAGGLRTTRLEIVLRGPVLHGTSAFAYRDGNYAGRIGWKEIVVPAARRLATPVAATSFARTRGPAREPARRDARLAAARARRGRGVPPVLCRARRSRRPTASRTAASRRSSAGRSSRSLVILSSLAAALFWGAAHALSPGPRQDDRRRVPRRLARHAAPRGAARADRDGDAHGRRLRARLRDAPALAVHRPRDLYPWLNLASGLLVVGIGASVLRRSPRPAAATATVTATITVTATVMTTPRTTTTAMATITDHDHGHDHGAPAQGGRASARWRRSASRAACCRARPRSSSSFAAISFHRVGFGLALIVAFSLGLALSITGVGLVAVLAKRAFSRISFEGRLVSLLPAVSALVILVAGVAMTLRAFPEVTG